MKLLAMTLCAGTLAAASTARAQQTEPDAFLCAATPEPVIALDHGSRYVAVDKSRSQFDQTSNDDVNAQLKPIDAFIGDLVTTANRAVSTPDDRDAASNCVLAALSVWAEADALSNLGTMNANLSAPARIGGLAFAYAQVRPFLSDSDNTAMVERWLTDRARQTMKYFDTDAPTNASQNNLRAWAGLAVARIGLTVGDTALSDWAAETVRLVACQVDPDGSLPREMARKELALHYQLHAVTPLVVTAALLEDLDHDLFRACDMAIHRTVYFVVDAFQNPDLVKDITGSEQTYFNANEELRSFELAWAEAYLSLFYAPDLDAFVKDFGTLSNSKLGGKQSLLWGS